MTDKKPPGTVELPGLDQDTLEHIIVDIELVQIEHGPFQIRELDNISADLAASMKLDGLLHPITVRQSKPAGARPRPHGPTYEIIAGHRRFEAAKYLGWSTIRSQVATKLDDQGAYRLSVTENLRRVDLTPLEEAKTFKLAIERLDWTEAHLQKATGRSVHYISQRLDILDLDEDLQARIGGGLSPAKAFTIAPLGQFDKVKGVASPLTDFNFVKAQGDWTQSQVIGWVEEYFDRNSFPIKGWDSDICKKKGCLGSFGEHKALCLDFRHAFEMIVAARKSTIVQDIEAFLADHKTAKMGITAESKLPVYYDLDRLRPSTDAQVYGDFDDDEGPETIRQPRGYPRCPFTVLTYSYGGTDRGAFTWKVLMEHVTGAAREKCLACPAWKKGAEQGRALFWSYGGYYGQSKVEVQALCMGQPCRAKQIAKSAKDPAKKGKERLRSKQMAAVQPFLQETAEGLYQRLLKDPARILALSMVDRYKLNELPFMSHKLKEVAQRRGIKIPDHDGTPNGLVKALASVGEKNLIAMWADHAIFYLDNLVVEAFTGFGKPSSQNLQPKRMEATARAIFGDTIAHDIWKDILASDKRVKDEHNKGKAKPKKAASKEAAPA